MSEPVEQAVQVPPYDPGNPGIQQRILAVLTAYAPPEAPGVLLATIRCGGATLTVHLGREDAVNWGRLLIQQAQQMSSLIVPNGTVVPDALRQNGSR